MGADRHKILTEVGRTVAVMHDGGLVHGDLTTSNMIVRAVDTALVSAAHKCRCRWNSWTFKAEYPQKYTMGKLENHWPLLKWGN
jgi:RIO-like serine/threonine protein kinase